jgi:hypothetical protein
MATATLIIIGTLFIGALLYSTYQIVNIKH